MKGISNITFEDIRDDGHKRAHYMICLLVKVELMKDELDTMIKKHHDNEDLTDEDIFWMKDAMEKLKSLI